MITISTIQPDFEVQAPKSNYLNRLPLGATHIRILGPAISGWEWWEDTTEGGRKPIRIHLTDSIPVEHADDVKKFLAWPVWNYDASRIQIFSITQTSIQKELIALEKNKKWGDLKEFDIEIERSGNDKNTTKYSVRPEPKTEYEDTITKAVTERGLPHLEALFEGGDPFNFNPEATESLSDEDTKNLPF